MRDAAVNAVKYLEWLARKTRESSAFIASKRQRSLATTSSPGSSFSDSGVIGFHKRLPVNDATGRSPSWRNIL